MSSGGGGRVSIPSSVRKMIETIKEITGNHSDDEIHAMLKECSMDPNETAQKLLLQDTFHEVKRKRERKKENLNKETTDSSRKPAMPVRGNRGGRGNYSPRYDAVGGRNAGPRKENGSTHVVVGGTRLSTMPTSQDVKNKEIASVASPSSVITDSSGIASRTTAVVHKLGGLPPVEPPVKANRKPTINFGTGDPHGQLVSSSSNISTSGKEALPSATSFTASDPVLMPSQDSRLPSTVGTIKRAVAISQRPPIEQALATPSEKKSVPASSEVESSFVQGKAPIKSQVVVKNQLSEFSQPDHSSQGGPSVSRPSSNYNNRPQQVIGPQKGGPSKEWKPKPTNTNISQGSRTVISSEVPTIPVEVEADTLSHPALCFLDSKIATSEIERKLDNTHISDSRHVIIPYHLHVPEAVKLGFCFGSFDANFSLNANYTSDHESDKSPLSEDSEGIEQSGHDEHASSNQIALEDSDEVDYLDCPPSSSHIPETLSSTEDDVSSTVVPEFSEPKQEETPLLPGGHQHSMVHTSPNYSFGVMPPILGSQLAPFESTESQFRDVSRLPSFVVQQQFDPASYYAQIYRPDNDGHISPFYPPGVASKHNGNLAALSPQSSQESGNSLLLSTAGPTSSTQVGGVMQNPISVSQQPLPVYRQPLPPHFHPNYIPYAHYYTPFYVPPPGVHQLLSNGAFPQQTQTAGVYPAPPVPTAKYSLSQYKPGSNMGNSTHIGVPGSYGSYGSSQAGYNPSSATTGNSTSNEDLAVSQFKENNIYVTGQQGDGSGMWIAAPGRDVSGLQANSFYNLPQGGQVAFNPTQAASFAGIYHHPSQQPLVQQSQPMSGPTTSVYQHQPQPTQMNWPNNY